MASRLGIDVGGTNTDLVLVDESGAIHNLKTPVAPGNPVDGIIAGLQRLANDAGVSLPQIETVVHSVPDLAGQAAADGARIGLLVTAGFEHVLHLARGQKPGAAVDWVVATVGVPERMDAHGQVRQPLDEGQTTEAIRKLVRAGVTGIAVSFLHAASNAENEQAAREIASEVAPEVPVTLSSDVVPEAAEYERTTAAVLQAAYAPAMAGYFKRFSAGLSGIQASPAIRVARSDGGAMSVDHATEAPLETLSAGVSSGVAAAAVAATSAGQRDALAVDMGGAATTIGAVLDGVPVVTRKTALPGANVTLPAIDITRAGAGGGSVVRITDHGALRVGPESAADGPACFGGSEPTLTDANVVLGLLPTKAIGGGAAPDSAAAESALGPLADKMRLTLHQTAQGVRDLANEKLYGALRQTAASHGVDVATMAVVAYGVAGPLHGNALGILCGDVPVIVPAAPGMMSARGFVSAAPRREFGRSYRRLVDDSSAGDLADALGDLGAAANRWMDEEGAGESGRHLRYEADLGHRGQAATITIDVKPDQLANFGLRDMSDRFQTAFEHQYGVRLSGPVEIIRLRAIVGGRAAPNGLRGPKGNADASVARIDEQRLFLNGNYQMAHVYNRSRVPVGGEITGPALVQAPESTTVIHAGFTAVADHEGALLIERSDNSSGGFSGGGR